MTALAVPSIPAVTLPPEATHRDLRAVIEHAVMNDPRTLQVALGPSEIGLGCDRCLAHLLAGHAETELTIPWLPTIGNAVHDWLETTFLQHLMRTGSDRYLPEVTVNVGQLRGVDIKGHSDLFDAHTGTTVDWKIVGATTLKKVKTGPTVTYRNQLHLYGLGMERAGWDVRHVAIWFLPRNAMSIDAGRYWTEAYDRSRAEAALARANAIAAGVDALGIEAVLAQMPAHTGAEFTCTKWAGDGAPTPDTSRQLAGLIPA